MSLPVQHRRKYFIDTLFMIHRSLSTITTHHKNIQEPVYRNQQQNYILHPFDIVMIDDQYATVVTHIKKNNVASSHIGDNNVDDEKQESIFDEDGVILEYIEDKKKIFVGESQLEERARPIIRCNQLNICGIFAQYVQHMDDICGQIMNSVNELIPCKHCGWNYPVRQGAHDIHNDFYCDFCWDKYHKSLGLYHIYTVYHNIVDMYI